MTIKAMGCFGSVMLYNEDDAYCRQCPRRVECGQAVEKNKVALEEALGAPVFQSNSFWRRTKLISQNKRAMAMEQSTPKPVVDEKPADAKPAPAPEKRSAPAVATVKRNPYDVIQSGEKLPTKVEKELGRWASKGIDPLGIEKGVNPFTDIPGTKVAFAIADVYLEHKPASKPEFKRLLADALEKSDGKPWSDASLNSNLNIVLQAFAACGHQLIK